MLKISLKQGQYVNIGDNIRVVYVGGTGKSREAYDRCSKGCQDCKEYRRTKSGAQERYLLSGTCDLKKKAQDEIKKILWNERMKAETKKDAERMSR